MYYSTTYDSPLGVLTIASDGESLVGLWMEGQKYFGASVPEEREENNDLPVFDKTKNWLDRYFAGEQPLVQGLSLAPSGSEFRHGV